MAVVITSDPRRALGVGVTPTHSQACPDPVLAGRNGPRPIQMVGNAPPHRLGERDAEPPSPALQPAMLFFGQLYLQADHPGPSRHMGRIVPRPRY